MIELNRSRNNVVLSRRAVLEDERKEMRQAILDRLNPGDVVEGTISNIVDFGAFVDLDGMDGLIHISELSWSHVNHPSEVLEIGQTVEVKVLDIDRERQRISLGLKQTQSDPWQQVLDSLRRERRRRGPRHEGRHVRRLRRDPPRRRGARAHLRAREPPCREPARGRLAGRPGERPDPRDRRRAPAALALAEARRGGRSACSARRRRRVGALDARPEALRGGVPDERCRGRSRRAPSREDERGRRCEAGEDAAVGRGGRRGRGRRGGRGAVAEVEDAPEEPRSWRLRRGQRAHRGRARSAEEAESRASRGREREAEDAEPRPSRSQTARPTRARWTSRPSSRPTSRQADEPAAEAEAEADETA